MKTNVTFIGTGHYVPEAGRDTLCAAVNGKYLFDLGWCAPIKMLSYGLSPMNVEWVFLTHCHHDHYLGLAPLFYYLLSQRHLCPARPPVHIAGPKADVRRIVELAQQYLYVDRFPSAAYVPEVVELELGQRIDHRDFHIETCSVNHFSLGGLAFKLIDRVTGASLVFGGDTAYHPPIAELAKGCDLLIHEAGSDIPEFESVESQPGSASQKTGHSTGYDAARIAAEAGVGQLAIGHIWLEQREAQLAAARSIFPHTILPGEGDTIELPSHI